MEAKNYIQDVVYNPAGHRYVVQQARNKSSRGETPSIAVTPASNSISDKKAANERTTEVSAGNDLQSTKTGGPYSTLEHQQPLNPDISTWIQETRSMTKADIVSKKAESTPSVKSNSSNPKQKSQQFIAVDEATPYYRPSVSFDLSTYYQQPTESVKDNVTKPYTSKSIIPNNVNFKQQLQPPGDIDLTEQESSQPPVPHISTDRKESAVSLGLDMCCLVPMNKEQLEVEPGQAENADYHFIKLHATWDALVRCAEVISLNMPLAPNRLEEKRTFSDRFWTSSLMKMFDYDRRLFQEKKRYFVAPFTRDREDEFLIEDRDTFFSDAQRSILVHHYLSKVEFDPNPDNPARSKYGYQRLLAEGFLLAAYPLHPELKLEEEVNTNGMDLKVVKGEMMEVEG